MDALTAAGTVFAAGLMLPNENPLKKRIKQLPNHSLTSLTSLTSSLLILNVSNQPTHSVQNNLTVNVPVYSRKRDDSRVL